MESSRRVNPSTIDLLLTRRSALAKDLIASGPAPDELRTILPFAATPEIW